MRLHERHPRRVGLSRHKQAGSLSLLVGNQQPEYWALFDSRRRHRKAMKALLQQTIEHGLRSGLIDLRPIAIDGTEITNA